MRLSVADFGRVVSLRVARHCAWEMWSSAVAIVADVEVWAFFSGSRDGWDITDVRAVVSISTGRATPV